MYWREETSGKMESAVNAYWLPYTNNQKGLPELSDEHINILRMYIVHWAKAPCWLGNPHINSDLHHDLELAIEEAESISDRKSISQTLNSLLELGIDPF